MIFRDQTDLLFTGAQAEHTADWFARAVVVPRSFKQLPAIGSIALLGASGTGKTTLRLTQLAEPHPDRLTVIWLPQVRADSIAHTSGTLLADLHSHLARTLVTTLGREPGRFEAAPAWAKQVVETFVAAAFRDPLQAKRLSARIIADLAPDGQRVVRWLLLPDVPHPVIDEPAQAQIEECVGCLPELGLPQTRIVLDGVERFDLTVGGGAALVEILLGMLGIFEIPDLTFWLLLSDQFTSLVTASRSIERRRLVRAELTWEAAELAALVERRLTIWSGRPHMKLSDLAQSGLLLPYLHAQPATPRAWIEALRPFVVRFTADGSGLPLDAQATAALIPTAPHELRFIGERVFRNRVEITDLTAQARQILRYLNTHRGNLCTRDEIYYRAINDRPTIPARGEPGFQEPTDYRRLVDTAISRLRDQIEPDPNHPIFILTVRGRGVKLCE